VAIELAPPVLDPEPGYSPGTENTVYWSSVPGADAYYVECDDNPDFSSPEQTSGWIADTQHTFADLTDGETYYYRVRARQRVVGEVRSWTQTTQGEFDTNTLVDTEAVAAGEVVLAGGSSQVSTNAIENPSYETLSAWTRVESDPQGISCLQGSYWSSDGAKSFTAFFKSNLSHSVGDYGAFRQTVDWTWVDTLTFDACSMLADEIEAKVLIGGTEVWSVRPSNATQQFFNDVTIDVSEFKGSQELELRAENMVEHSSFCVMQWDHLRTYARLDYSPSGTATSTPITVSSRDAWGELTFDADAPAGTTLSVDVLPETGETPIPGYANIASGTSLAGITDTTIRLRSNLATTDLRVSPVLRDWSVTWCEPDTFVESEWSEETVFSTQASEGPTDISLSSENVDENQPVGTLVGVFSAVPTEGGPFSYALVAGVGDEDNSLFTIEGSQLKTAAVFNYEMRESDVCEIRVEVTDGGELTYEEAFTIAVNDLSESMIPGDANDDGAVDSADAARVAASWGAIAGTEWKRGDFNGDGKVNLFDAAILAANWGATRQEELTAPSEPGVFVGPLPNDPFKVASRLIEPATRGDSSAETHDAVLADEYGAEPTEAAGLTGQSPPWTSVLARRHGETGKDVGGKSVLSTIFRKSGE
jgi:hypothetical protein